MQAKNIIKARAIVPIYFSTVTNTSKKISYMLQQKLQAENFVVTVTNIGDLSTEQLLEHSGPIVFILSTYGNGGSPADGDDFVQWLRLLQKNNHFENFELCVLGLGNRSFEHFCGNSKSVREAMILNGAKQIIEPVYCNSSSTDQTAMVKFPEWSDNLVAKLKQKYQIKEINAEQLLQKYKATTNENQQLAEEGWLNEKQKYQPILGKQFLSYYKSFKCDVIHIKELRQENDGRSTLWIRLKTPQGFDLQPASNVSVYPENTRKQEEQPLKGSVRIQSTKKKCKIPYPPLPLERLWRISNFNQIADLNLIKFAVTMSKQPQQIKMKYQNYLKSPEELEKNPIRCYQLYDNLKPGIQFLVRIGINSVRPYTLASWAPEKGYFDLVAAIDPKGLTSRYFQSNPLQIRAFPTRSSFYVPSGRPIVMIANGSGIAPFRSLTQCILKSEEQLPKLYLYFGIQKRSIDFYFKQEWEQLQKQGKIKLRIAESRASQKKVYVQQLVKEDKQFFANHLFQEKGVIFICGTAGMSKGVDTQIFEAIKIQQPVPFKAFKLSTQLTKNKTIVREVFD